MASSPVPPHRRRFVFDLHKPIMTGTLLKQGGFHKAFKERYFILYPGFLVYYSDQITWQCDLQRGETLGGRIGAYKLRGGKVYKSSQHPKAAKYSFMLHAPDPHNKRHEIMFNCLSGEERYQWMHKIASAVPDAPDAQQKAPAKKQPAKEQDGSAKVKESGAQPEAEKPQDTVKEDQEKGTEKAQGEEGEKSKPEPVESDATPSENAVDDRSGSTTPDLDVVLGPITRSPRSSSSEEDSAPPSRGSVQMEPESCESREEDGMVVSTVTVRLGQEQEVEPEESPKTLSREGTALEEHTTEACAAEKDSPRLSITVINTNEGDFSDTSSSDDEEPTIPPPFPIKQENGSNSQSPQLSPVSPTLGASSTETCEQQVELKSPGPNSAREEALKPGTPTSDRRRPSGVQAFDGKKGYMYKMGGRHKSWKLRYFVLMPGQFSYYKNDPKGKCLGEVKLKDMKILLPKPYEKKFSSFQFTIHTESSWNRRCDYVLAANSERDMKDWIDAFKIAGGLTHINGRSVSPADSGDSASST